MNKAQHSPCYKCMHILADKDYAPCDTCMRPVRYVLRLIDVRLIKELYQQDKQRAQEISNVIINERYLNHKSINISTKLDLLAIKNGFPNSDIWLRHLYEEKELSPYKISDVVKISPSTVRKRLIGLKLTIRTRKEAAGRKWTEEEKKKVSKSCKGKTPWNKGKTKKKRRTDVNSN